MHNQICNGQINTHFTFQEEDRKVIAAINGLVRENVDVLSGSKTSDDCKIVYNNEVTD